MPTFPVPAATVPLPALQVPDAPALVAGLRHAAWVTAEGEFAELAFSTAARRATAAPPIVCHGPATAARLGVKRFVALDTLELFAFVRPGQFCVPTPGGLAAALGVAPPFDTASEAVALVDATAKMLRELRAQAGDRDAIAVAQYLGASDWIWAPWVLGALGAPGGGKTLRLDVWSRLPEWAELAPPDLPGHEPVEREETLTRLAKLLGANAEPRLQQRVFATEAAGAFAPRDAAGEPRVVLAEAGTGIGKTLGYIAPASIWAEKNGAPVWLSTYTRNLQRQIDTELDRLYPDPAVKRTRVVVRKGRENYLCLLNLEEEAARALAGGGVGVGLTARWVMATRDGDLGGDFPAWLPALVGHENTTGLSDRRGECIYSACRHYRRCFIERAQRRARRADLVIANHALVLATLARSDDARDVPLRFVFDEGHHVFDAADSAFSAHLTGQEAAELRRWLRGPEGARRRGRGLADRIGDLIGDDEAAQSALSAVVRAAGALPAPGWLSRLRERTDASTQTPTEAFLGAVRAQVIARQTQPDAGYSLEAPINDPVPGLLNAAGELFDALEQLAQPLAALAKTFSARLDDETATLEEDLRQRMEAAVRGLARRSATVAAWRGMLASLREATPEAFVDWFSLEREWGRDLDAGMHRHWVDPTAPFAEQVLRKAHGALITSASLRDVGSRAGGDDFDDVADGAHARDDDGWAAAEVRTGALHLPVPPRRVSLLSPFDYAAQTRILIVRDVNKDDPDQVAAAYRELFLAAGGGGLGLFTAISRLRAVHKRIAGPLEDQGLKLLAQHVDAMDTATLVDIFRAETDTCLLGTDAVRDGVDVPGASLRLIVFDRVPWPRPDMLHKARKQAFGGAGYDDRIARLRLRQAYGRLVRRADDRGVFVMLDARTPTRLLPAFPPGVAVERVGIAEAVAQTKAFLAAAGVSGPVT